MNKVFVIGANSFSGQDFVDLLLDYPEYNAVGVSRSPERSALFLRYKLRKDLSRYRYVQLDLNQNMAELLYLLDTERPDVIVNFAAQSEVAPSWDHPQDWYRTNCVALAELVNHLRRQTYLKKYIHISSPEVYGNCIGTVREDAPMNPSTPYASSKAAADALLQVYFKQFRFPVSFIRATNVYGARQQLFKIIPRSVIYLRLGKTIELHGGGVAKKSYIHVRDVSQGIVAALKDGESGEIYHLSPAEGVAIRDVVRMICERLGQCFEDRTKMVDERPGQDTAYIIDATKAHTTFGWSPKISLKEGLADVVSWVETGWNEISKQPLTYEHKI